MRTIAACAVALVTAALLLLPSAANGQGAPAQSPVGKPSVAAPHLDSILNDFVKRLSVESPGSIARSAPASSGSSVAVSIHLTGSAAALVTRLQAAGVLPANVLDGLIEAYVPVTLLPWVAQLPGVERVSTIVPPQPDVVSQGAAVHNAPNWNAFGYTGTGVKVGIIDVGFIGYTAKIGSELPTPAAVRCYTGVGVFNGNLSSCEANTVHGAAVAETIIDEAPNVSLYLADPQSYADLLASAQWMVSQGVQVINHSVGWTWDGPGDGTSPDASSPLKAVDAASAGNIVWVNSSGNSNQSTFTGDWTDANANNYLDFASGPVETDDFVLGAGSTTLVQMRWDDSWTAAARDLDLELYNGSNTLVAASTDVQSGTAGQVPYEALQYTAPATGTYHLKIKRFAGTFPAGTQVQLQVFTPNVTLSQLGLGNRSIGSPAESADSGMIAVGATNWQSTSVIESYSSQGPTRDGRTKPDITGADCASTVTYGVNGFCGTSQASPHVAGLAALVRQAYPSLTAAQVAAQLEAWAIPRGAVPNNTWGAGLAFLQTIAGKLAFTQQPSNGNPGVALPTQPIVTLQDSTGATVASDNTSTVTLSLNGPGTLSCTGGLVKTVTAGVATFAGCAVSAVGTGDTITATPSCFCLTTQSASFNIAVPPNHLAVTTQPSNGVTNVILGSQPVFTIKDPSNATVTGDSTTVVTLSVGTGPPGGTLSCTGGLSKTASSGVATFAGCKVTIAGTYVIHAAASGTVIATDTASFVVTGPATKLVFVQQPSGGTAGTGFGTQPAVSVEDASGAVVTTDSSTTVTLALNNAAGATLTCAGGLTKTAINGVASFAGCAVNNAGTGYSLHTTSSPALTATDSATFDIAGVAAKLTFSQQPSNGVATVALATQPIVLIQDANGATLTTDSSTQVTLTLTGGSGGSPVLSCTSTGELTGTAINGVVTFAGCKVSLAAALAYGLHAASGSLTATDSASFVVTGPATKLAFVQQPASGLTGKAFALQPVVAIEDASGATVVADNTTQVTLSLKAGSTGTLTCSGSLTATAVAGLATFSGCSIDAVGTDTLHATSSPALTAVDGAAFGVSASSGSVWYFAEGFTGGGPNNNQWQTYLYLLNATTAAANVTITYFQQSGAPTVKDISIPAQSRRTMFANDPAEGPGNGVAFGVKITSDQPITAQQSLIDTSGLLAHGSVGSQVLSPTWYFAEGFTGNGWITFISATNPGNVAANVALTYHLTDGTSVTRNATVPPQSRFTFAAHDDPNNPAIPGQPTGVGLGQAFAVSISSDQPIVSQEVLIDTVGLLAHGTIGVTSLDTAWYFAEGVTTNSWLTFLSIGNLSGSTAHVTATYNILGQAPVARTITLAPGARGTFAAQDDPNMAGTTGVGPDESFGVTITSDVPIVAQEVLIDPKPGVALAHAVMGAHALNTAFTFGGGTSEAGWLTFISATNPGASPVSVTATYYFEGGAPPVTQTVTLAANSRTTFASFDPATGVPAGLRFGVKITASAPIISQEVVIDVVRYLAYSAAGTPNP